ncbi:hypothetical protein BS50DRAFT_658535 [Corynespora cassiicola Philippines]|uniref:ARM repeat-containing protein n=1 Tax=Corynespora cassiicola Philippines TaxID=1448308 RepID=A0A2T2P4I7_CORCC|nr:hypothetical protein BS50DRAFT_658535 [Corynespora cassiicola Philippines]
MVRSLDTRLLRAGSPAETAQHLRDCMAKEDGDAITLHLIDSVEKGSFPPSRFAIWLSLSSSPSTIRQALEQNVSIEMRILAINSLRKKLASPQWRLIWDELGGIEGILRLANDFSVKEVQRLCDVIGRSGRGQDKGEKRIIFTQLLKALMPLLFPESPYHSPDRRPLGKYYQRLVPACTPDFVDRLMKNELPGDWSDVPPKQLLQEHSDTLQKYAMGYLRRSDYHDRRWFVGLKQRYPSATTPEKGFSESMQFSLEVLHKLVKENDVKISDQDFVYELVLPLLKRCIRKRVQWARTKEIVDLVVQYTEQHPKVAREFDVEHKNILHFVAMCWSRKPEMFEDNLRWLLAKIWGAPRQTIDIRYFEPLLTGIKKPWRYSLLRLCIQATDQQDIDLKSALKYSKHHLSDLFLEKIGITAGLGLFIRQRNARGDENLVTLGSHGSILCQPSAYGAQSGDPELYHTLLLQQAGHQEEAESRAEGNLEKHKNKAMISSDQGERAFNAKSAVNFSIASGSLSIYKETMLWARRYIRDSRTSYEIFGEYPSEAISLLIGLPHNLDQESSPSSIRDRVVEANTILRDLFKTVCLALREPSFNKPQWNNTLSLFTKIIEGRRRRSKEWQVAASLSDDEVYHSLWEDSLRIILETEKEALLSGYEPLGANIVCGILQYQRMSSIYLKDEPASTYRFLDELAKERDELWRSYRPTVYPAVANLPGPFPRGLPIQHLTPPYRIEADSLHNVAPYIASRVHAAVFPDPDAALAPVPRDKEYWNAIGAFVDDYFFALRMFIPDGLEKSERAQRSAKAWEHVVGPLSEGRMDNKEAVRYWQTGAHQELSWPPDLITLNETKLLKASWPTLPGVDDPTEVEEWNPVPGAPEAIESRNLDGMTYTDISRIISKAGVHDLTIDAKLSNELPNLAGQTFDAYFQPNDIWSWSRIETAKGNTSVREGQILSAVLYLDSRSSGLPPIMSHPFPSADDARYPAVYLDPDLFPDAWNLMDAFYALKAHIKSVPTKLLAQLAERIMQALDSADPKASTTIPLESLAFQLIELLRNSDRPSLASKLVVNTIIQRPDASSWHRRLLSPGFFKRLPASAARECFSTFADAIIKKLDEQNQAKESAVDKDKEYEPQTPRLKITTVKFLAQLLRDTVYVSEEFNFSVLSKLTEKVTHIDIRLAVVSSLVVMLKDSLPELTSRIMNTLELMAPIAGNINERRPISEASWTQAEETLTLPEVEPGFSEVARPMSRLLFDFFQNELQDDTPKRREFFKRIISPTLQSLKVQTSKYTALFLQKHGFDFEARQDLNLPPVPGRIEFTKEILRNPTGLPLSLLEEYISHLTFNISPPVPIRLLNKKLNADPQLRSDPSVQYWLSLYGLGLGAVKHECQCRIMRATENLPAEPGDGLITRKAAQEQFLKMGTAVLWNDAPQFKHLGRLMSQAAPGNFDRAWAEHKKPVVEAMALYVDSLRTREWERDAERQPQVLPDMFMYRMWLLGYPDPDPNGELGGEEVEAQCKALAGQLAKLLDQMAGSIYHKRLEQIKAAMPLVRKKECRLLVALHLGDITKTRLSWLTLQDQLRVELAEHLLEDWGSVKDEALKKRVQSLIETWRKSGSEEVRRFGLLMPDSLG